VASAGLCASLHLIPDNHANIPPLSFLQTGCPSCRPTNSVKALKEYNNNNKTAQVILEQAALHGWGGFLMAENLTLWTPEAGILGWQSLSISPGTDISVSRPLTYFRETGIPVCLFTYRIWKIHTMGRDGDLLSWVDGVQRVKVTPAGCQY